MTDGPGFYDSDGTYIYGEADAAAPGGRFSDLLNKGLQSVKNMVRILTVETLASDSAPAAAAAAAVDSAIATRDLVEGDDPRMPVEADPDSFRVRDRVGALAFEVDATGNTHVYGDYSAGRSTVKRYRGFRIRDQDGRVALDVRPDGSTFIGDPDFGTGASVTRLVVLFGDGQSNMEGRMRPYSAELDPDDARLFMWDFPTSSVKRAAVPLSSQQQQTGLSVLTVIAREILANEPAGTAVLIVNCGVGNSGLVAAPAAGSWQVGYAGPNPHLNTLAKSACDAALAAASAMFPGLTPDIRIVWHQGEADAATSQAAYATAFDAWAADWRTKYGAAVTIVLGGLVPEYITTPGLAGIRAAHVDTPRRLTRTAYADGIPNGGGAGNVGDIVHYAREGGTKLGKAMYAAYRRAAANVLTSTPVPPLEVTATYDGATLALSWSPPVCRVTAFAPEYSADAGAWTAITHLTIDTRTSGA